MQRITPRLHQIASQAVNSFVIEDGDGLVLVDTGEAGSTERIFKAVAELGKSPSDIHSIILTHTHPDHAGSAADLVAKTGAKVYAHPADAALAKQGLAGRLPHQVSPGLLSAIIFRLFIKNSKNAIAPLSDIEPINDGDVLPIAGGLRVIHTPGHSAGHVALYLQADDVLIAGDLCANMMGIGLSTVYEDRALGIKSILKATEIPFQKAVFGHGKPILKDAALRIKAKFKK